LNKHGKDRRVERGAKREARFKPGYPGNLTFKSLEPLKLDPYALVDFRAVHEPAPASIRAKIRCGDAIAQFA
jgi:hypothetical protein